MNRYLIYYSYIGTQFRGVQKQFANGVPLFQNETIQSILETGLSNLKRSPVNYPKVYPASRTDQGVHALCTTAHVDLEFPDGKTQSVLRIIRSLNKFFYDGNHDIRVLNVQIVPPTFSARYSVIKKKYLYRFAVLKPDVLPHLPLNPSVVPIPIAEKDRCFFIYKPIFENSLAEEATKLFIGTKDYLAFMGSAKQRPDIITERVVEELVLKKGAPFIETQESDYYDFWNVECTGRSFLYRQVRRMVGALIAVGQKQKTYSDIEKMFLNPTKDSWDGSIKVVPGYGLYLSNIIYNEEDLLCEVDSKEETFKNNYQM